MAVTAERMVRPQTMLGVGRKARLGEIRRQAGGVILEIEKSLALRADLAAGVLEADWSCARFCGPYIEGVNVEVSGALLASADPETAPPSERVLWAYLQLLDREAHHYGGCAVSEAKRLHMKRLGVGDGSRARLRPVVYQQHKLFG